MWCVSNDCLVSVLNSDSVTKSGDRSQFYSKLNFILQSFNEFFHAGGHGLSEDQLDTDKYKVCTTHFYIPNTVIVLYSFSMDGVTVQHSTYNYSKHYIYSCNSVFLIQFYVFMLWVQW